MNKLILAISILFSLNSFSAVVLDACQPGDKSCAMKTGEKSDVEAGALATGITCEACHAYEVAQSALLSNNSGIYSGGNTNNSSSSPDTSAPVNKGQ